MSETVQTIEEQLDQLGVMRARAKRKIDDLDEQARELISRADGHLPRKEIASLLRMDRQTLYNWLDRRAS